jgi:hypothetical protein
MDHDQPKQIWQQDYEGDRNQDQIDRAAHHPLLSEDAEQCRDEPVPSKQPLPPEAAAA